MRDNMPNYLNMHNIDPGRVEAAPMRKGGETQAQPAGSIGEAVGAGRSNRIPGFDSIRPGVVQTDESFPRYHQSKQVVFQPPQMSNAEAAEILKDLEVDIYGRVAIAKAIEALESSWSREVQELLNTFPLSVEDIRIFAQWHQEVGASGEALRDCLKRIREDDLCTKVYLVELVSACHALISHSSPIGDDKVICDMEDIRRLAAEVEK